MLEVKLEVNRALRVLVEVGLVDTYMHNESKCRDFVMKGGDT